MNSTHFISRLSLIAIFLFLVSLVVVPSSGLGAQITVNEFKEISSLLEKEVGLKYGSDAKDEFSDTVTQVVKGNLTQYHRGDPSQPVFLCVAKDHVGKKVVVIERGADYIIPEDKNTFVVLRQKGGGKEYNVHTAIVFEMGKNKKIVVWDDARIEQQEKSAGVLNVMGSRYLPRWKSTDMRPRCEWIASILFCNAKKTVGAKNRKFAAPPPAIAPKLRVKSEGEESGELGAKGPLNKASKVEPTEGAESAEGDGDKDDASLPATQDPETFIRVKGSEELTEGGEQGRTLTRKTKGRA